MSELKEGYPARETPKPEEVKTLPVEDPTKGHVKKITDVQAESSYFSEKDCSEGCNCDCGE